MIYKTLADFDPELYNLINQEENRQIHSLELIASENFASVSVLQVNSSILTNKYSSGEIGRRYYGGIQIIDGIESLCKKRALEAFNLDPEIWDVNVQPLSGSAANLAAYTGLIGKDGKIMGLDLSSGGHLTHGYKSKTCKASASSLFFDSKSYRCNDKEEIDYEDLEISAKEFKPDLIICGGSAYVKDIDYARLRKIAGDSYLMMDMAHVAGFILAGLMNNPFDYCDVVTTTSHKILRGPRSGMIFYKRIRTLGNGTVINIKKQIDSAVYPGLQGAPHNQKIGALAVALKQVSTDEYKQYIKRVYENAQVMADEFKKLGYKLYSNGTCCHMILLCLPGLDTNIVEKVCECCNISVNKNIVSIDTSSFNPRAIRLGTPALTTRGFTKFEFIKVVHFVDEAICIAKELMTDNNLSDIADAISNSEKIKDLKDRISKMCAGYPFPKFHI